MLIKFNSEANRIWGTYYGGSRADLPTGIDVDSMNNVYISGATSSLDVISHEGHQNISRDGGDGFLVKFSPDGSRKWGTFYGGARYDFGIDVHVDSEHQIFLTGFTASDENIAFNGFKNELDSVQKGDGFFVKFTPEGQRVWGSYYGGEGSDVVQEIEVDNWGNIIVAGNTTSNSGIVENAFQSTNFGFGEGFVAKFNPHLERKWSTYYGGTGDELIGGLGVDKKGNVYMSGLARSPENISFNGFQDNYNGKGDLFLVKLDSLGNRVWGTYFGTPGEELHGGHWNNQCAIDTEGNIFLCGMSLNTGLSLNGFQDSPKGLVGMQS